MMRRVVANITLFDQVTSLVAEGQEVEVPTKGNSMLPFIVGGKDSITVGKVDSLAVGDIVLAKVNDTTYVVHRIFAIDNNRIILMGDGNVTGKEICTPAQVCAKVLTINHNGKIVDCNTPKQRRLARLWRTLLPVRRYILGIWRRTPFWPNKPQQKHNTNKY